MDIEQNFQFPITHLRKFVHYLTIKELRSLRLVNREFNHCVENQLYEFNFINSYPKKNYEHINKFQNIEIIHLPCVFDANFQLDYINPQSVNTLIYKYFHCSSARAEEISSQFPNLNRLKFCQDKMIHQINQNLQFLNQIVELSLDKIKQLKNYQIIFACPMLEKLSLFIDSNNNVLDELIRNERSPKLKGLKLKIESGIQNDTKLIEQLEEYFAMQNTLQILQINLKVKVQQTRLRYLKCICANKSITHLFLKNIYFEEYPKLQFNRRLKWIGIKFNYELTPLFQDMEDEASEEEESDSEQEQEQEDNDEEQAAANDSPDEDQKVAPDIQEYQFQQPPFNLTNQQGQQIEHNNQQISHPFAKPKPPKEYTETPEILDFSRNENPEQTPMNFDLELIIKGWQIVTNAIRPGAPTKLIFSPNCELYLTQFQNLKAQQYTDIRLLEPFANKFL